MNSKFLNIFSPDLSHLSTSMSIFMCVCDESVCVFGVHVCDATVILLDASSKITVQWTSKFSD